METCGVKYQDYECCLENANIISAFCCCKKVFTLINTWMIGKKSSKDFYSHLNVEDVTDADYTYKNRF